MYSFETEIDAQACNAAYVLLPEVSRTPKSGCLTMAQTDKHTHRHTDKHGNAMTDPESESVTILIMVTVLFFFGYLRAPVLLSLMT